MRWMPFIRNARLPATGGCDRGASAIEFALVAPMLFLMLFGLIELSLIMFTYAVIDTATTIGSRIGRTGYTTSGLSREDYIQQQVGALSMGVLDPSQLTITITSYSDFSSIGQAGQGQAGAGGAQAIVVYQVTYPWTIMTPMMNQFFGTTFNIQSIATVRNENF